jgi:diamine N-acetyltransferase
VSAPAWRVRPARPGDRDRLLELLADADELHARLHPSFFRADYDRRNAVAGWLREDATTHGRAVLVAECDGIGVSGLAHVQIYDTPAFDFMVRRRRANLEDLVVDRAHRRAGCGRALIEAAASCARRMGAEQLLLTVWAGNEGAERFYEALGYRTISTVLGTDLAPRD